MPKPAKVKQILSIGLPTALILGFMIALYVRDAKPPPRRKQEKKQDVFQEMARTRKRVEKESGPEKQEDDKPKSTIMNLSEDVLKIAPHIYYSVRLELVEGGHLDQEAEANRDLKSVFVRLIEIFIRAPAWNRLRSTEKIDLLYSTFEMLHGRYPDLTEFIRLIFDDGRKNLDLKFDDIKAASNSARRGRKP